ncbi:MAG TPA: hypothetical protein PK876_01660 [Elusimicrobiota bacterium]|nr:hypothetical protein [Elusimicrobiota bacterium]
MTPFRSMPAPAVPIGLMMKPTLFNKPYQSVLLHWFCLLFITGYVILGQYGFAITDRVVAPDHDYDILTAAGFMGGGALFSQNPPGYVRVSLRRLFSFGDGRRGYSPHTLILALCFIFFGKTLFVYKMSMVWALLGLAFGVYVFLYRQTKMEMTAFLGTLLVLVLPNVVKMAGLYFGFLPLACVMMWALNLCISMCRCFRWRDFFFFIMLFFMAVRTHYSGYLYFGILGFYLFLRPNTRRVAIAFLLVFFMLFYKDMNVMPRWFFSFLNLFHGGLPLTPLAVGDGHDFYRGMMFCFRGLKRHGGPATYSLLAALLPVYIWFHRKYIRPRIDGKREVDAVVAFLLFCMGALLSVMLMTSGVAAGNFTMFYVLEAILLTLLLWDMSRYMPRWMGTCVFGILVVLVLSQQDVYSARYERVRKYWGQGEELDLVQLMHYIQTEQDASKRGSTVCLVAGAEMGSGGQCDKMYDLKKNISCLDSRAFYSSMRISWVILNPPAGLASQKAMRDLVDNDMDRGGKPYDYLFVFVGDERREMDDREGRARCFEKYLEQNGDPLSHRRMGESYRLLAHYPIDMGMTLTVYRNRRP